MDITDFQRTDTYHTYKIDEIIVENPIIITSSFLENTLALKLMIQLQELSN